MPNHMDEVIEGQAGAVSARLLCQLGVDRRSVRAAVAAGRLTEVRRGAFVVAATHQTRTPEQEYAVLARAVLQSRPPGEVLSHHAALAMRGLPLYAVDLTRVDLMGAVVKTTLQGIARIRPLGERAVALVGDARCVTVAEALVQVALFSGASSAVIPGDQALRLGLCSLDEVAEAAGARRVRATKRIARLLGSLDPGSESVGESRTRLILSAAGFSVRSQYKMLDEAGTLVGIADLLVDDWVVVEFDGAMKYAGSPDGAVLFAEKRREDRFRELGYLVVRLTWADLARPARLISRVRAAQSLARSMHPAC